MASLTGSPIQSHVISSTYVLRCFKFPVDKKIQGTTDEGLRPTSTFQHSTELTWERIDLISVYTCKSDRFFAFNFSCFLSLSVPLTIHYLLHLIPQSRSDGRPLSPMSNVSLSAGIMGSGQVMG